jgi:hypothetical protein
MPNYYIDIIDTQNSDYVTILEDASKSSIVLSYKGSDAKDELSMVGSTLKFTILVSTSDNIDGVLAHLLTGDEQRYKIELRKELDNTLIWQGFTLPDTYNEPYKQGVLNIDIVATDGIGRLKGKFLPDAFYKDENKVTDIIAECLKLTGLSMPFYFSPAIENFHQPRYDTIFLQGKDFVSNNGKKDDAYKILEYLTQDLLFCVFQSMGYWYLEGLNKRNLVTYAAYEYTANGVFVNAVTLTRNIKVINKHALSTPNVSSVVPYGIIEIDYEREELNLDDVAQEENTGWVVLSTVNPEVYSNEFIGSFFVKSLAPDYDAMFKNNETTVFDPNKKVSLRNKLYAQRQEKFKLKMVLEIQDMNFNQRENIVTEWTNEIYYEVKFNDTILFTNYGDDVLENEILIFKNKQAIVTFEFIAPENGMIDIVFYQPFSVGTYVLSVLLKQLDLSMIGFQSLETYTDLTNSDFTKKLSKTLEFSDDATGYGKSFLLARLNENSAEFNQINIPILYSFVQNGKFYSAVNLDGAKLIGEELQSVMHSTNNAVVILGVIYNYQGLEAMLVETNIEALTGAFIFNFYYKVVPEIDRFRWYEWADSLYNLERLRFADIHTKIYRRLFRVTHVKADLNIKMPVLFNDIIQWQYAGGANYSVSNLQSWNIDNGVSKLTINQAIYQNEGTDTGGDNLPPFVDAGQVIYISDTETTALLNSVAFDADGFIAQWQWQQITSVAGVAFVSPNNESCELTGLSEDFYTFQITVTDNDGATATDTVDVIRLIDHLIVFTQTTGTAVSVGDGFNELTKNFFRIDCTPAILDNFILSFEGLCTLVVSIDDANIDSAKARIEIIKNGAAILDQELRLFGNMVFDQVEIPISFSYISTDVIFIQLTSDVSGSDNTSPVADSKLTVNNISFVVGQGQITTVLPLDLRAIASI